MVEVCNFVLRTVNKLPIIICLLIRVSHKTLQCDAISGDEILTVYGLYESDMKKKIRNKDLKEMASLPAQNNERYSSAHKGPIGC